MVILFLSMLRGRAFAPYAEYTAGAKNNAVCSSRSRCSTHNSMIPSWIIRQFCGPLLTDQQRNLPSTPFVTSSFLFLQLLLMKDNLRWMHFEQIFFQPCYCKWQLGSICWKHLVSSQEEVQNNWASGENLPCVKGLSSPTCGMRGSPCVRPSVWWMQSSYLHYPESCHCMCGFQSNTCVASLPKCNLFDSRTSKTWTTQAMSAVAQAMTKRRLNIKSILPI